MSRGRGRAPVEIIGGGGVAVAGGAGDTKPDATGGTRKVAGEAERGGGKGNE